MTQTDVVKIYKEIFTNVGHMFPNTEKGEALWEKIHRDVERDCMSQYKLTNEEESLLLKLIEGN